jgi:hypothetical protein
MISGTALTVILIGAVTGGLLFGWLFLSEINKLSARGKNDSD